MSKVKVFNGTQWVTVQSDTDQAVKVINLPSTNSVNLWELETGLYCIKPNTSTSASYGTWGIKFYYKTDSNGNPTNYRSCSVPENGVYLSVTQGSTSLYSGGNKGIYKYYTLIYGTDSWYGSIMAMHDSNNNFLYTQFEYIYDVNFYTRLSARYGDDDKQLYKHTFTIKCGSSNYLQFSIINTEKFFGKTSAMNDWTSPTNAQIRDLLDYILNYMKDGCMDVRYYTSSSDASRPATITSYNNSTNKITFAYLSGTSSSLTTYSTTTYDISSSSNITIVTNEIAYYTNSWRCD